MREGTELSSFEGADKLDMEGERKLVEGSKEENDMNSSQEKIFLLRCSSEQTGRV